MSGAPTSTSAQSKTNTSVVRYNLDGRVEFLPSTNQPRVASACASYKENGDQVGWEGQGVGSGETQNMSASNLICSSCWWLEGSQTMIPIVQPASSHRRPWILLRSSVWEVQAGRSPRPSLSLSSSPPGSPWTMSSS